LLAQRYSPLEAVEVRRVEVHRIPSPRKPFLFRFCSPWDLELQSSPGRAALLLALLIDLQDRTEGGGGVRDILSSAAFLLSSITQEDPSEHVQEKLRVAAYRLAAFWREQALSEKLLMEYNGERLQRSGGVVSFGLEVCTDDSAIEESVHKTLHISPIEKLKRRHVFYVPPGGSASEQLLAEIYQTPGDLEVTSLYFKPSLFTYPESLLPAAGFSKFSIERWKRMVDKLERNELTFTEILEERTLWEMITATRSGKFFHYPAGFTQRDVARHLMALIERMRRNPRYHLILTPDRLPFYAATYRARDLQVTLFIWRAREQEVVSWVAISDGLTLQAMGKDIAELLIGHPSTTSDRDTILSLLEGVLTRLQTSGPLTGSLP
jgi:hypothetical protein